MESRTLLVIILQLAFSTTNIKQFNLKLQKNLKKRIMLSNLCQSFMIK
jgi:hypothetical protein